MSGAFYAVNLDDDETRENDNLRRFLRRYPLLLHERVVAFLIVVVCLMGVGGIVYSTGGLTFVYAHAMYVPVVLGSWFFGFRGGILAGIVGGVILGPWMPLDVASGVMQTPGNWIFRTAFLSMIGAGVGYALDMLDHRAGMIRWLSEINSQTGIPNRNWLRRMLKLQIQSASEDDKVTLFALDIYNYESIVDTLGYAARNEVLKATMNRLRDVLPPDAAAGTLETNRLGIVVNNCENLRWFARELRDAFTQPVEYSDLSLYLDTSVAAAQFPTHGSHAEEIIQKTQVAMHTSRLTADRFTTYETSIDRTNRDNLALLGELPATIRENKLAVFYQPVVELTSNRITGVEALVRWPHEQKGLIPPGRFVPQVENTGLVHTLTDWVLGTAMRQLKEWRTEYTLDLHMAINISARAIQNDRLILRIKNLLERAELDPEAIELEITESAVMYDIHEVTKTLRQFSDMGVRLSIDDFGTGYSSLQYLSELPVDTLKIDRAFVFPILENDHSRRVVELTHNLAHTFGMTTIAEGVEDEPTIDVLRELDVGFAQGFGICRPKPAHELLPILQERSAPISA